MTINVQYRPLASLALFYGAPPVQPLLAAAKPQPTPTPAPRSPTRAPKSPGGTLTASARRYRAKRFSNMSRVMAKTAHELAATTYNAGKAAATFVWQGIKNGANWVASWF